MANTDDTSTLKTALTRERRTNRRLRTLIDLIREEVRQDRLVLDLQVTRLGQLQAELDALKTKKAPEIRNELDSNKLEQ